ncbi:MAG: AI-2E family transporter [Candidatus Liptonbacteria bacterium]|nr:AI-2E family transporter [Candidatus Liptonbacteria bacterium]
MDRVVLEISWASIWRVLSLVFLGFVFYLARDVLVALLLVLVVSAGLAPIVNFLESKRIPRVLATLALFAFLLLALGLLIYAVLPVLLQELGSLITGLTSATAYQDTVLNFKESANAISGLLGWLKTVESRLFAGDLPLADLASNVVGGVTLAFSVIIISFYLTASKDGVERFFRAILPEKSEEYVIGLIRRASYKIGTWFQTQILLSALIGIAAFIGLSLLNVPYNFLLAALTAVLEIVPFVGPIFAGALAVGVAFSQSGTLALYTLLFFIAIQQLESHVAVPLLFRQRVGLHPVVVLSSLLIGLQIAGIIGIILAVPVAVVLQEVVEDWGARKAKSQGLL